MTQTTDDTVKLYIGGAVVFLAAILVIFGWIVPAYREAQLRADLAKVERLVTDACQERMGKLARMLGPALEWRRPVRTATRPLAATVLGTVTTSQGRQDVIVCKVEGSHVSVEWP
jgi:hypothetical protein